MNKLWTLILFMGLSLSAMAGITVPKAGDIILQGDMAVVTIRSNALGWHGKKVLVKAKEDFELVKDVVEYGHFFENGALELQREASIAMGALLPWQTRIQAGNRQVFHPNAGSWVYHSYYRASKGPYFYIMGEKITTEAKWLEAGGVPGAFVLQTDFSYMKSVINSIIYSYFDPLQSTSAPILTRFSLLSNGKFIINLTWQSPNSSIIGIGYSYNITFTVYGEDVQGGWYSGTNYSCAGIALGIGDTGKAYIPDNIEITQFNCITGFHTDYGLTDL